jgi:peptidoglycan/LPS O-acetylase OafA/YrhL
MNYIKQLDSIRAIAVFFVIIWHWIPRNSLIENLHIGPFGVNIFFVLSGFLITRILLFNRSRAEASATSKTKVLKHFYSRRMLRIFPVYYLTILFAIVLNHWLSLGVTTNEIVSNLTYTSNFFIYGTKAWPLSSLHFWSLAVEEQFYLAWPFINIILSQKILVTCNSSFHSCRFWQPIIFYRLRIRQFAYNNLFGLFWNGWVTCVYNIVSSQFFEKSIQSFDLTYHC